jgi:uncharacterized cupin superfamily protein
MESVGFERPSDLEQLEGIDRQSEQTICVAGTPKYLGTPFESETTPFPRHKFVRLLEGEIVIAEADGTVNGFKAGDVFFVPKDTVCSWKAAGYVKKHCAVVIPPRG